MFDYITDTNRVQDRPTYYAEVDRIRAALKQTIKNATGVGSDTESAVGLYKIQEDIVGEDPNDTVKKWKERIKSLPVNISESDMDVDADKDMNTDKQIE
jgi:hypothetical protein